MNRTLEVVLREDQQTIASFTLETDLDVSTLFQRMSTLVRQKGENTTASPLAAGVDGLGKTYKPLAIYLQECREDSVTLSNAEIEKVLDKELPKTAWGEHARSFWANTTTHSQGRAWLAVGWRVNGLDLEKREVTFRRR